MSNKSDFKAYLISRLNQFEYLVFNQIKKTNPTYFFPDIILRKQDLNPLFQDLKRFPQVEHIRLSTKAWFSKAEVKFNDNASINLFFKHAIVEKGFSYLSLDEILIRRYKSDDNTYQPSIEFSLEHAIIKSHLDNAGKGLSEKELKYFSDFHVLLQEDILEYFNQKYATSFSTLDDLSDFDLKNRSLIVKKLKSMPTNQFIGKMNTQWYNFLGSVRQARII